MASFPVDQDWHSTLAAIATREVDRVRARGCLIDRDEAIAMLVSEVWIAVAFDKVRASDHVYAGSSGQITWGLIRVVVRRRLIDHIRKAMRRQAREDKTAAHAPMSEDIRNELEDSIAFDQLVDRYVAHKTRNRRHVVEQQPQRRSVCRQREHQIRQNFARYSKQILCRRFD